MITSILSTQKLCPFFQQCLHMTTTNQPSANYDYIHCFNPNNHIHFFKNEERQIVCWKLPPAPLPYPPRRLIHFRLNQRVHWKKRSQALNISPRFNTGLFEILFQRRNPGRSTKGWRPFQRWWRLNDTLQKKIKSSSNVAVLQMIHYRLNKNYIWDIHRQAFKKALPLSIILWQPIYLFYF